LNYYRKYLQIARVMEKGMKNYGKKWDVTSPTIKMKEKYVWEDLLHLRQQVEKERGGINRSENTEILRLGE